MEDVKFVYFDVGYTLVDESLTWKTRCHEQAKTIEAKTLHLSATDIYYEIVRASINYQPQYRTVVEKYQFKQIAPYRHEYERLYGDCIKALEILSGKYNLGIIANQTDGLSDRLKKFGILRYFTEIISSWDCKIMKPDLRLFKFGIERARCKPSQIVMVGDRLDNDIYPANCVGMKSIWIKQGFGGMQKPISASYCPTAEISCLNDLLSIL